MSVLLDRLGRPLASSASPLRAQIAAPAPRAVASGGAYRAADSTPSENGWYPSGGSADRELANELPRIMERSNEAFRNDPLAQGIGWAYQMLVVAGGRTPRPQIRTGDRKVDREVQRRLRRDWMAWATEGSSDGVSTYYQEQERALDSMVMGGGALMIWPSHQDGTPGLPPVRVGMIDLRRLSTPRLSEGGRDQYGNNVSLGVASDKRRRVQGYWIKGERLDGSASGEWLWFPVAAGPRAVARLIHRPGPMRPGQSRQPPLLTAALSLMYLLRQLLNAEMRGDIAMTRLLGAIKSGSPEEIVKMLQAVSEARTGSDLDPEVAAMLGSYTSRSIAEVGDANILNLMPSESTEWFNAANRSNPGLATLLEWAMRWVASCTGLPYQVCWMLFQGINYSNARTVLMHSTQAAEPWRARMDTIDGITWRTWLWDYWAMGLLPEVSRLEPHHYSVIWQTVEQPYLDPMKESYANEAAVKSGQVSMPDVVSSRNGDWQETLEEQVEYELREKELYEEAGLPWPPSRKTGDANAALVATQLSEVTNT